MVAPRTDPHSANLRAELTRAGLTQRHVAALLGIWQPDVSYRMRSWRWRPGELEKIAERCGVPLDRIQPPPEHRLVGR